MVEEDHISALIMGLISIIGQASSKKDFSFCLIDFCSEFLSIKDKLSIYSLILEIKEKQQI